MEAINLTAAEFLSAFFAPEDTVCFRVFSDRKDEEPDYKGNKYAEKLKDVDSLLPVLNQHNERNRGVFFMINSGAGTSGAGHTDNDITRINAQFVENDTLSFNEQMARLEAFPLPPSVIVKTQKSLHAYWLVNDADVSRFREIQLRLVKQFDGDSMCQNESRVMRLSGFLHCKSDPVMVECVKFDTLLRYTQDELAAHLPESDIPAVDDANRSDVKGVVGDGQRIIDKCTFCRYCRDNAAKLSEPEWYAMVTNIAPARDGVAMVHEISKPYPKYKKAETDEKIRHALAENKPHTCEYIKGRLGFKNCTNCDVKSPVVHCVLTMAEQADELLDAEFDEDSVFVPNTLRLMAYAKKQYPAAYGRFKQRIKGKVSIRDFENAVRHEERGNIVVEDGDMPLNLADIDVRGAVQPGGWDVSMEHGVRKNISSNGGYITVTVCPSPVVISKRFENVDTKCEKAEISFYRDHNWKRFSAARSSVFNKSALIGCADRGLPVNSSNAGDMVAYLSSYETANLYKIPLLKSTERLGWLSDTEFFPYTASKDVCFETELQESDEVHRSLSERGSYEVWHGAAAKLRQNPFARFMLASSFAAPLLEPLSHRVFFVNIWHDTTSGKSAAAKLAVAAWGNPLKIMGSFNATAVGLERKADTLRNILYGLDERQLANEKRLPISQIVYGLANGFGRIRGAKEGGVQSVTSWRTIVLSTGEEPLITEEAHDGLGTRVLELHGQPAADKAFGKEVHTIAEKNYGFAGRMFIERLCKKLSSKKNMALDDFQSILTAMREKFPTASQLENAAAVALGDFYSDMWLFNADRETAFKNSVQTALLMLENNIEHEKEDIVSRAWQHVQDWCVANDKAFGNDAPVRFGLKEGAGTYYILKFALDESLQRKSYPVEKCKTGFFERGYMRMWNGKRQKQKKQGGVANWYYVVEVPVDDESEMTPL
jgi:uncharacterized protein (DUF927 family)